MRVMGKKFIQLFSTESVAAGHPDKIADQIGELILDYIVGIDPDAHVACEVLLNGKEVFLAGEIKCNKLDENKFKKVIDFKIRNLIENEIGYTDITWPNVKNLDIKFHFQNQSREINSLVQGIASGDNSSIFGWAENSPKTKHFPRFQFLANEILKKIGQIRKNSMAKEYHFAPDGKIQILTQGKQLVKIILCQQFVKNGNPHDDEINKKLTTKIKTEIIESLLEKYDIPQKEYELKLKPFHSGGPANDTGLTGRKLMVDTYGTFSPHGGGSFSGKDVTKPDKTLALFARYIAWQVVEQDWATTIQVQLSTHIGQKNNFQIWYSANENAKKEKIEQWLNYLSDWTFTNVIDFLELKKVKFASFGCYGYFGRTEKTAYWENKGLPPGFLEQQKTAQK